MKKQIVVSSYKDDLSFLSNDFLKDIPHVVYEKGSGNDAKSELINNRDLKMEDLVSRSGNTYHLPNIGLCGQSFLFHICENYDKLADATVFIAGDCLEDSKRNRVSNKDAYRSIVEYGDRSPGFVNITNVYGNFPVRGEVHRFFNARFIEKWEWLFEEKCPRYFRPAIDSTFIANKEAIRRRPLEFYKKALSLINEKCYTEDHWKMSYQGEIVSVLAPSKKNLQKYPHKSPLHFDFSADAFMEHCWQKILDVNFRKVVLEA